MPIWGCIGSAIVGESGPGSPDCGISGAGGFPSVPEEAGGIVQAFSSAPIAGNAFNTLIPGNTINSTPRKAETIG
jgi:hypothetical protein